MFDPERIVMQAASTEPDIRMIEALVKEALKMVHARESDMHLGPAEPALGWNFYLMSVDKAVAGNLRSCRKAAFWMSGRLA